MNKAVRKPAAVALLFLMIFGMVCCSKAEGNKSENCGSWAYIHDKETEILRLDTDWTAIYHGDRYTYTEGDGYLELTGKDGEKINIRFIPQYDYMLLYEKKTYTYDGDGEPSGIVGLWKQGNLSFEFTSKDSFIEDGVFPGHYILNESDSSIKLAYNDHFPDIYLYYGINGNELVIDYPMPVVKMD